MKKIFYIGLALFISIYSMDTPKALGERLITAAAKGQLNQVRQLVEKQKANVNYENAYKNTPLIEAARKNQIQIIQFLIDNGATVNHTNIHNRTALMIAAANGHLNAVQLLINNGADSTIVSNLGETAYSFAKDRNYHEVAKYLLKVQAQQKEKISVNEKEKVEEGRQQMPGTIIKQAGREQISFHPIPSYHQTGLECGLKAINNAGLFYQFCSGIFSFEELQKRLLNKKELAFRESILKMAQEACGNAAGQSLSGEEIERIARTIIPEENLLVMDHFNDISSNIERLGKPGLEKLYSMIQSIQIKKNAIYAFLFNTAGFEVGSRYGHWTTIVLCKKNNQITGYVANSTGLYSEGTIKPTLNQQINWLTNRIAEGPEKLYILAMTEEVGPNNQIDILIQQLKFQDALNKIENIIKTMIKEKLFDNAFFQQILHQEIQNHLTNLNIYLEDPVSININNSKTTQNTILQLRRALSTAQRELEALQPD